MGPLRRSFFIFRIGDDTGSKHPNSVRKKGKKMRKIIIVSFIIALIVVAVVPIALIATGAV